MAVEVHRLVDVAPRNDPIAFLKQRTRKVFQYYYMDEHGMPQESGWVYYAGKYYYLENYNPVVNKWIQVDDSGIWYHFNKSGVCDNTWKAA